MVTPSAIAGYANALRWTTGGGNSWTARQVLAILRNHVYAGLVTHDSRLRQGCHPAQIVDDAPEDLAICEFDCRREQCTWNEWETCERRIRKAAGELFPAYPSGRP